MSKHGAEHLEEWKFKPGESGNPKGRPKRESFETLVRRVLDQTVVLPDGNAITKREALAEVFVSELIARNPAFFREFLKREWPEITQHLVAGIIEDGSEDAQLQFAGRMDRLARRLTARASGDDDSGGDPPSV